MFNINYTLLEKIRPLIDQAKELEKSMHRKTQEEKSANQVLQWAQDADLELDEDLQYEVHGQLGAKAAKRSELMSMSARMDGFKHDDSIQRKRETK